MVSRMHCIAFITRVFLDEVRLFRNGEHDWHIGHRLKVLLYRVLNFMFLRVNDHGFFFSRNFSRSPSVRVVHLDFDFDISLNSLWESFLLSSDVIVADGIVDLDLIDEVNLIDEVIEVTEAILEDVDDEVVVLVADDVDVIFDDADKADKADKAAKPESGIAAEVPVCLAVISEVDVSADIATGLEGAGTVVFAIASSPLGGATSGSPGFCLICNLPCTFLGLVSDLLLGLLGDLL